MIMNVHDFKVKDSENKEIDLSTYKGKVLLIVNTATQCGLTPQYEALEKLYKKYDNLEVLDFPCNQFLSQAPGTNSEIVSFCQTEYDVTFKIFSKIEVNGENADPLYKYLKEVKPNDAEDSSVPEFLEKLRSLGQERQGAEIKWNFTKFLVDKDGNVVERFAPTYAIEKLDEQISKLV